jgi:PIN domain nuclease of toxin-antitoxin system
VSRLLLDTQAIAWWDLASRDLGPEATRSILDAEAVDVSAASEWELAIKAALGKITLRRSILEATLEAGFEALPVSFEHALAVRTLKPIHKDPFDRLLVAAALVEGLTLVSSDAVLAEYPIRVLEAGR